MDVSFVIRLLTALDRALVKIVVTIFFLISAMTHCISPGRGSSHHLRARHLIINTKAQSRMCFEISIYIVTFALR
ncbi:MAG: hypothetical protein ACI9CO_000019 [Candidatus Azotimanducaceae bacterium]|jgi:hypothetical protein